MNVRKQSGLTLVELLVATFIFATLSAIAWGGFQQLTFSRTQARESLDRIREVQFAVYRVVADLEQINARPVRDPFGETFEPALGADIRREVPLILTRGGWNNPAGIPRSTLQRVAYELEDNTLKRGHWYVLDRTPVNEAVQLELLSGVLDFSVRFLDRAGQWRDEWPPEQLQGAPNSPQRDLPIAVEVNIELEDYGLIRRLVEVTG